MRIECLELGGVDIGIDVAIDVESLALFWRLAAGQSMNPQGRVMEEPDSMKVRESLLEADLDVEGHTRCPWWPRRSVLEVFLGSEQYDAQ